MEPRENISIIWDVLDPWVERPNYKIPGFPAFTCDYFPRDTIGREQTSHLAFNETQKEHGTGLKDDLLATDASGLQVDEGSHLLGPGMLGNEAVAGLLESGRQMRSAP